MGAGAEWDEAVWILTPEGDILIHRIGAFGRFIELEPLEKVSAQASGFSAERYYLPYSDEGRQEEFLYLTARPDGVWEVRLQVKLGPEGKPVVGADLQAARQSLDDIFKTIRLP